MKILRDQTFWLGAMTAFAIVFFFLFVGMAQDKVSFHSDGSGAPARAQAPTNGNAVNGAPAPASPRDQVVAVAKTAKVNAKKFAECIDEGKYVDYVKDEIVKANKAGAQGTPYSIAMKGDKKAVISGALPKDQVIAILDGLDTAEPLDVEVAPVTDRDYTRGAENGAITIIEYSDIDCPFCKRFHTSMKELIAERDDITWVYRHLPLAQLHPNAAFKAEASECAGEIGGSEKFWTFLDGIIEA